ncbi:hypothetical protein COOONC_15786 [Cooperia oncophora]
MKAIDIWMGSCMAFVFGVMIEFTICHFAKNQELLRCEPQPSLIVDTALSTLFGAARDIDDLEASSENKLSEVNQCFVYVCCFATRISLMQRGADILRV